MNALPEISSNGTPLGYNFETYLNKAVTDYFKDIREDTIKELIKESIANKARIPRIVELKVIKNELESKTIERQHEYFPLILAAVISNIPLMLVGPAGSGKTTACIKACEAVGLDFALQTFSLDTSKTDLFGYQSVKDGKYIASSLYSVFKKGGAYICDEIDNADSNSLVAINGIISNRICTFPNGETIKAHKDFRVICAANTQGLGADERYCGRNQLDAATLDRFAKLSIPYDEGLEQEFLGIPNTHRAFDITKGGIPSPMRIHKLVLKARETSEYRKWLNIVSPRASLLAYGLSNAGIGETYIRQMVFHRGLNPDQIKTLDSELNCVIHMEDNHVLSQL